RRDLAAMMERCRSDYEYRGPRPDGGAGPPVLRILRRRTSSREPESAARSCGGPLVQADREAGAEVRGIRLALEEPSTDAGVETSAQEPVLSVKLRAI